MAKNQGLTGYAFGVICQALLFSGLDDLVRQSDTPIGTQLQNKFRSP